MGKPIPANPLTKARNPSSGNGCESVFILRQQLNVDRFVPTRLCWVGSQVKCHSVAGLERVDAPERRPMHKHATIATRPGIIGCDETVWAIPLLHGSSMALLHFFSPHKLERRSRSARR
jgi:hypothetical protein